MGQVARWGFTRTCGTHEISVNMEPQIDVPDPITPTSVELDNSPASTNIDLGFSGDGFPG